MKAFLMFFILICCLLTYPLLGQISPPNDFSWKVKHLETTTTFYVADKTVNLTALDKSHLKSTKNIQIVEKYYTSDNNMPLIFIERIESQNIYKDWMTKPHHFIINANGISAYNTEGGLMKSIPHPDLYNNLIKPSADKIFPTFQEITNSHLQTLQNEGLNVTTAPDGSVVFLSAKGTLIYNAEKRIKTITKNNEDGAPISVITTQYIPIKSVYPLYANEVDVIPQYVKEVFEEKLPSGVCTKFVRIRHYEDYEIQEGTQIRARAPFQIMTSLEWYPNPALESLTIINSDQSELTISIYGPQGQLVKRLNTSDRKIVDISDMARGIYILSIKSDKEEKISKFIKL